jgi:hypothetical protein
LTFGTEGYTHPEWSSDGNRLYYIIGYDKRNPSIGFIEFSSLDKSMNVWSEDFENSYTDIASTPPDALYTLLAQSPSVWDDLPLSQETALDLGTAEMKPNRIADSPKFVIAVKPPDNLEDHTLVGFSLQTSYEPR